MTAESNAFATDLTVGAAEYLAHLEYDMLPLAAVDVLKAILLDTLGTTLAAGTLGAGCGELIAFARACGGTAESTVIGFGDRMPAAMAAFVNGGLAHALNYDAVGAAHLGIIPPAPLALAERAGDVSGSAFLAALAAGCELAARIGVAAGPGHPTVLLGQLLTYFGGAAASAHVLNLSPEGMQSTLGLALMQAAGARQIVIEGDPPAKAIYGSFPSQAGVTSAMLASLGLGAASDVLGGEAGVAALIGRPGNARPAIDLDFGSKFYLLEATFKPWPVSGHVTLFVEAAIEIAAVHELSAADLAHVRLTGPTSIRNWFEPVEKRKRPQTSASAANSIYFAVAKALTNRSLGLSDFSEEGLVQSEVLRLTDRMEHTLDNNRNADATVEVTTSSGTRYVRRVRTPLGAPSRPMGWDRLAAKFRDCAAHSATPISSRTLDLVIELVATLEEVPDVGILPTLLSGRGEQATR